jgi:phosphatidate cytidylyltransferase
VVLGALAALAILGGYELAPLLSRTGLKVNRWVMMTSALLGLVFMSTLVASPDEAKPATGEGLGLPTDVAVWSVGLSLALGMIWGMRTKDPAAAVHTAVSACFACVYLGVFPASMLLIRAEFGAWVLLAVIGVIKVCDIGAYFTGRAIGRHKLIPWLSPGKTWEGLAGGVLWAAAAAAGLSAIVDWMSWPAAAFIGVMLGLAGQAGDLFESALKRTAGAKDSGAVPGFGGVLDLVDSPLVGAPAALWLLRALTQ